MGKGCQRFVELRQFLVHRFELTELTVDHHAFVRGSTTAFSQATP
jgi:hypothetical protein